MEAWEAASTGNVRKAESAAFANGLTVGCEGKGVKDESKVGLSDR